MSEKIDISEIFENAIKDPELLSTLDIEKLLGSLENDKNDYLENKTIKSVAEEIYERINEFDIPKETKFEYCRKLSEYRFVNNIHELHKGKPMRYIRLPKMDENKIDLFEDENSNKSEDNVTKEELPHKNLGKLMPGGIVVDIKFLNTGVYVLIKNVYGKFSLLKYDNFYIFQKLNMTEQLILMSYDYLDSNSKTNK